MNVLDILIGAIVLWGLWRGFKLGAIKTTVSLISWLAGLVAAARLASSVAPMFVQMTDSPVLQQALGFLAVFLLVIVLLQAVVYFFGRALKALRLTVLDKLIGAVLGATMGVLKVLVVLAITAPLLAKLPLWQQSMLAPALLPLVPIANTLIYQTATGVWKTSGQL